MKKIYCSSQYILLAMIMGCLATLSGCSKSSPQPQDPLKYTWSISGGGSVIQDGVDVTADYAGMTMTFSTDSYFTTNAYKLFKSAGTWKWKDGSKTAINLDVTAQDATGIPVSITINDRTLTMTFSMDLSHVNANGRTASVVGGYVIVMKR